MQVIHNRCSLIACLILYGSTLCMDIQWVKMVSSVYLVNLTSRQSWYWTSPIKVATENVLQWYSDTKRHSVQTYETSWLFQIIIIFRIAVVWVPASVHTAACSQSLTEPTLVYRSSLNTNCSPESWPLSQSDHHSRLVSVTELYVCVWGGWFGVFQLLSL